MKTLFILISALLTLLTSEAQSLMASVDVANIENHKSIYSSKKMNANYLEAVNLNESTFAVDKLQQQVAKYDIKSNAVYDDSEPATYEVAFKEGENRITVTYDNQGIVMTSKETYHNVPLPVELRIALSKNYPGWEFKETTCQINFGHIKGGQRTYNVTLKKGTKTITLKNIASL